MSKHNRAVELLLGQKRAHEYSIRVHHHKHPESADWKATVYACEYALRVLEAMEKLEPWMVEWLRIEANSTGHEQYCISPSKLEDIADAIEHAIGENDAQD